MEHSSEVRLSELEKQLMNIKLNRADLNEIKKMWNDIIKLRSGHVIFYQRGLQI